MSPALAGGFSTTAPPGKPDKSYITNSSGAQIIFSSNLIYYKPFYLNITYIYIFRFICIYFYILFVFFAALGLCCCVWAFSSCGEWGLLFVAVLSSCGSRALECRLTGLWRTGLVAQRHVGSSRTRHRTHVPSICRWILNHLATREVP